MKESFLFPEGFLWGSAVSAYQVEGGNNFSDWWAWERSKKRIEDLKQKHKKESDFQSGLACDFYSRFKSDFDLAKKINHNAFRLSLEWSRIQPEPGKIDVDAISHYREILEALRSRGIKSFVTLHHFTLPKWFADMGGFENKQNISYFLDFVSLAAKEFSGLVDYWITINEPEIYSSHAFLYGVYPPQKRNFFATIKVVNNLIDSHRLAYEKIREFSSAPISMAYHLIDLVATGFFSRPIRNFLHYILNEHILKFTIDKCDYIGVNYYGHSHVGFFGRRSHSESKHKTSDLGWGIHPEGLGRVLLNLKKFNKPIFITENGIADGKDTMREDFIKQHLKHVNLAIQKGVEVKGYLYWSLIDNFEWHHGFAPRFGLIEINYSTLERTVRKSALAYAKICKENRLDI